MLEDTQKRKQRNDANDEKSFCFRRNARLLPSVGARVFNLFVFAVICNETIARRLASVC